MSNKQAGRARGRVLIVEDDFHAGLLISRHLRAEGLSVTVATTAAEGRDCFRSRDFDLVVVDLRLGSDSGIELIPWFRKTATRPFSILVLTGCTDEAREVECLDAGADDFLRKPVHAQGLRARVRVLLRHANLERRLRSSRAFYRSVFDSIGDAVWITDDKGVVVARNAAADRIGRQGGRGQTLSDWLGPDVGATVMRGTSSSSHQGGPFPVQVKTPRGRHLLVSRSGFVDDFGTSCSVVVGWDRTEAEQLRGALVRTRGFLENVVRSSADAIVATDEAGSVVFFSAAAEEVFGYASADVIGTPVARYYMRGVETAREVMDQLRKSGKVRDVGIGFRHRNGRVLDMDLSASLLRGADGTIIGTVGILKDVSGVERQTRDRLRQGVLEAEGRVSAMLGHQVRNFLGIILGRTQLADRHVGAKEWQAARDDLDVVCKEIERMGSYAEELMGRCVPSLDASLTDVGRLMRVLAESLDGSGRFSGRQIRVQVPETVVRVAMRGRDLEATLVNLLENAADASPLGEAIELACSAPLDGRTEILVRDRGSGIEPDVGNRVLEECFTTKEEGHGLGLAIVKSLVEEAGGEVGFRARTGGGTEFSVRLPVVMTSQAQSGQRARA